MRSVDDAFGIGIKPYELRVVIAKMIPDGHSTDLLNGISEKHLSGLLAVLARKACDRRVAEAHTTDQGSPGLGEHDRIIGM